MITAIFTAIGTMLGILTGYYIREHQGRVKIHVWAKSRIKLIEMEDRNHDK